MVRKKVPQRLAPWMGLYWEMVTDVPAGEHQREGVRATAWRKPGRRQTLGGERPARTRV
jgi:hypothetical protein